MSTPPVVSPSTFSQPPSNASGDEQSNTNGHALASNDLQSMQFPAFNFTQETGYPPASDGPVYAFGRPAHETTVDYPRRRATIACEICRSRKSRCDGQKPKCKLCTELNADCVYREPGVKLDAGDRLILERLSRIEGLIQATIPRTLPPGLAASSPLFGSEVGSNSGVMRPRERSFASMMPVTGLGTWSTSTNISTMPGVHTNAAMHLLRWPIIRNLVSKPYEPHILLQLELSREPLEIATTQRMDFSQLRTATYARAFFEKVNVWYACVNPFTWAIRHRNAVVNGFRDGCDTCMVLSVLALGEASCGGTISRVPKNQEPPGFSYFSAAWQIIPSLMTRNTVESIQCMVLASAYLFYLLRPLEAWTLLSSISTKLQLLLSAPNRIPTNQKELCMRIYWNILLFESDLLAELDLPHSGIVNFEESVSLPGGFEGSPSEDALASDNPWYFLAEIALRRLLNRVSTLIYSQESMVTTASLEPIVNELEFQLTQWYEGLPPLVRFSITDATQSHVQTVLRLRYFACRTIIYRPYILAVLDDPAVARDPTVMANCAKCLEACLKQLDPITAHHSGSLPYAFQGALSIVSQTLLIIGASMCPTLQPLLPDGVDAIIDEVLSEMKFSRDLAPSLALSYEILREAEDKRWTFLGKAHGVGIV